MKEKIRIHKIRQRKLRGNIIKKFIVIILDFLGLKHSIKNFLKSINFR